MRYDTRTAWATMARLSASVVMTLLFALTANRVVEHESTVATMIGAAVEQRSTDILPATTSALPVVKVSVNACGVRSHGSGFVVAEGLVVTAAHVVGDAGLVRLDMGSNSVTGEVIGRLADGRDLALIAIDTGRLSPPTPGEAPSVGAAVTMVGYPGGQRRTVSVGPSTKPLPTTSLVLAGELIGVSAPTGEGFSGGPALDASGRLVGVVVAAEAGTGTSIVVALPDADSLADAALVPNSCPTVT